MSEICPDTLITMVMTMKHFFFRFLLNSLYWCLVCFFPLATYAKPAGEIIFRHPLDSRELWIGDVNNKRTARKLFDLPLLILSLSIQQDDRYLIAVAHKFVEHEPPLAIDAYLLDRKDTFLKEKNLTRGQYGDILDAAISQNGDVVFTTPSLFPINKEKVPARGLYLIPNREIKKRHPKAELLLQVDAGCVDWAPNGKEIAFDTSEGVFLINIFTKEVSQITKDGGCPVFSPDGKQLAFPTATVPRKLVIFSLANPRNVKHLEPEDGTSPWDLTWSADNRYIIYTLRESNEIFKNFVVPLAGGPPERILEMYDGGVPVFEWIHIATHVVEPENKLATLWGKLKQQDLK